LVASATQLTPARQKQYVLHSGGSRYYSLLLPASYGRGMMGIPDGFILLVVVKLALISWMMI